MKTTDKAISLGTSLLLVLTLVASRAIAEAPSFMGLGVMPGSLGMDGGPRISADGRTIAGADVLTNANNEYLGTAWVWRDGHRTLLSDMIAGPPQNVSWISGVSADGSTMVGTGFYGAYRWSNGVAETLLPTCGEFGESNVASGLDNSGQVVVGTQFTACTGARGWVRQNGQITLLDDLDPNAAYTASMALGVSGNGQVVYGNALSVHPTLGAGREAFAWTNGQMIGLGYLNTHRIENYWEPGTYYRIESFATDASNDGSVIVGYSSNDDSGLFPELSEAFVWKNGVMTGLGFLADGWGFSAANAVSDDGSVIIGWSNATDGQWAFVWDAQNGMRSVASVLSGAGVDLAGWQIATADDISADGTVIVGRAVNPEGQYEVYRAVIPEPAAGSFALAGLAWIILRRRP